MAGVTDDGRAIRLFPVRFRTLPAYARFKKFQWFTAEVQKSSDARPESYEVNLDSIRDLAPRPVLTSDGWAQRDRLVQPLRAASLEELTSRRQATGQSLGLIRPAKISKLKLKFVGENWTEKQLNRLHQMALFGNTPRGELVKIPYEFRYEWKCDSSACAGHNMELLDWEIAESYRRWRRAYGDDWESKLRERYEDELRSKYDTQWFVGTFAKYPDNWTLIGWYRPPRRSAPSASIQLELLER
jgi:hypothetical protein